MSTMTAVKGLYGPRGWTKQHNVRAIVGVEAHPLWRDESFCRFDELNAQGVQELLDVMPAENLDDCQNLAPQCGDLFRACLSHPHDVSLCGYVVGPQRMDERVSIDAVRVRNCPIPPKSSGFACEPVGQERKELWKELASYLGIEAGEYNMPDEMKASAPQCGESGTRWWLWWD